MVHIKSLYRIKFNLEDVALQNLEKLKLRAEKGKISGSGDDR